MWPIRRERLRTNIDAYVDAKFVGSIVGMWLTITNVIRGELAVGSALFGTGVMLGTAVTALGSGSGGLGTYLVSPSQNCAQGVISAGTIRATQATRVVMQLDIHGPNSADNVEVISTMFRDGYAVREFLPAGLAVSPLYADDPKQMPFLNDQQQYENRWVLEAHIQADQTVFGLPQEFMDDVTVNLIDVPQAYPA